MIKKNKLKKKMKVGDIWPCNSVAKLSLQWFQSCRGMKLLHICREGIFADTSIPDKRMDCFHMAEL